MATRKPAAKKSAAPKKKTSSGQASGRKVVLLPPGIDKDLALEVIDNYLFEQKQEKEQKRIEAETPGTLQAELKTVIDNAIGGYFLAERIHRLLDNLDGGNQNAESHDRAAGTNSPNVVIRKVQDIGGIVMRTNAHLDAIEKRLNGLIK